MRARSILPLLLVLAVAACADDSGSSDDSDSVSASGADGSTERAAPSNSDGSEPDDQADTSGVDADDDPAASVTDASSDGLADGSTGGSGEEAGDGQAADDAPPGELVTVSVDLPTGGLDIGPDDAFVATPSGALFWHPDLLTAEPGEPVLIAPSDGRNLIEEVAGVVDGSVIFGTCCDPVTGRVVAATGDEETTGVTAGAVPALSPDGGRLAAVSSRGATVIATTTGEGAAVRFVVPDENGVEIVPNDVTWAGGAALVVLASVDGTWSLVPLDPESLTFGEPRSLGIAADDDVEVELAGEGPEGEIAVAVAVGDDVSLRAFDAETLEEVEALGRELPPGVRAVRVNRTGAVLWVDDGALWHTPAGRSVPFPKGGVAAAAWFASPE